jgi:hypothetical protein
VAYCNSSCRTSLLVLPRSAIVAGTQKVYNLRLPAKPAGPGELRHWGRQVKSSGTHSLGQRIAFECGLPLRETSAVTVEAYVSSLLIRILAPAFQSASPERVTFHNPYVNIRQTPAGLATSVTEPLLMPFSAFYPCLPSLLRSEGLTLRYQLLNFFNREFSNLCNLFQ